MENFIFCAVNVFQICNIYGPTKQKLILQGKFKIGNNILRKGALSVLRQVLPTKSPLKLMKNAFYFTLTL